MVDILSRSDIFVAYERKIDFTPSIQLYTRLFSPLPFLLKFRGRMIFPLISQYCDRKWRQTPQ